LHDALRRRCLYHWIEYPDPTRAAAIVRRTVAGATAPLIDAAAQFVGTARNLDLDKPPGVAETIDWVAALVSLGVAELGASDTQATLGALAKTPDDAATLREALAEFSSSAGTPMRGLSE
jgi:MoxR-like ATPase